MCKPSSLSMSYFVESNLIPSDGFKNISISVYSVSRGSKFKPFKLIRHLANVSYASIQISYADFSGSSFQLLRKILMEFSPGWWIGFAVFQYVPKSQWHQRVASFRERNETWFYREFIAIAIREERHGIVAHYCWLLTNRSVAVSCYTWLH
jgi:hypothetical protein